MAQAEVRQLVEMGFGEADARRALQGRSLDQAVEKLLSGDLAGDPGGADLSFSAYKELEDRPSHRMSDVSDTRDQLQSFHSANEAGLGEGGSETGFKGPQAGAKLPLAIKDAEDLDLTTALQMSMREQQESSAPVPEGARKHGLPCGLLNIGNTCYVNSLLQTLLHIDVFRERMLRYRTRVELSVEVDDEPMPGGEPQLNKLARKESENERRRLHGVCLATELRHLFAYSLFTARSCIDPSRLLRELVDQRGEKLPIGSQEDVGEFMLKLLDQLDEGLRAGTFVAEPPGGARAAGPGAGPEDPAGASAGDAAGPTEDELDLGLTSQRLQGKGLQHLSRIGAQEAGAGGDLGALPGLLLGAAGGAAEAPGEPAAAEVGADQAAVNEHAVGAMDLGAASDGQMQESAKLRSNSLMSVDDCGDTLGKLDSASASGSDKQRLSLLQSLFFGEQVQFLSYIETDPQDPIATRPAEHREGAPACDAGALAPDAADLPPGAGAGPAAPEGARAVVSEERSEFLHIFLDVKNRSLYNAWEAARQTEVDYTTPSGSSTKACTSTWIKRLPKLLFFQLQRVTFDQESKAQVKLDDAFEFDLTIHVDRFLLSNQARSLDIAEHVRQLSQQRDDLEAALRGFEDYDGRPGVRIDEVLQMAADCVESNARGPESPGRHGDRADRRHPHQVCSRPGGEVQRPGWRQTAESAAGLLRDLREACATEAGRIRHDLESVNAAINSAYGELQNEAYELYAIWVHSGIAGSGHYFAYLRDWQQDRWYRLSDAAASLVSWDDVRTEAVGDGSNTSAYVLVYVEASLAARQRHPKNPLEDLRAAEALVPVPLLQEIQADNEASRVEQAQWEQRLKEQELRMHAEAIFQHYAGLIHQWEPLKRIADNAGNPHSETGRKSLQDPVLLKFEVYLYRLHGEQEVWTSMLLQSIEAQRHERQWQEEVHGRVLYFLSCKLRNQKCYSHMLREIANMDDPKQAPHCELVPIDLTKWRKNFETLLLQAHIIDEALADLKQDRSVLVQTIGALAYVWAKYNLENDYKFRQNEVLLLMSTMIFNTIGVLEKIQQRGYPDFNLAEFLPQCEYFLLLLNAVEWPSSWKKPVITRIMTLFPQAQVPRPRTNSDGSGSSGMSPASGLQFDLKEAVLNHAMTQISQASKEMGDRVEPGQALFDRHRSLYAWVMTSDEVIASDFMMTQVPETLRVELAQHFGWSA